MIPMNRIYKIIWNKARHAYVVVSEIARNHSKAAGKGSTKKAAALLAAVMFFGGGMQIEAAPTLEELAAAGILPGTNSETTSLAIGDKSSSGAGRWAIAIGHNASIIDGGRQGFGAMAVGGDSSVNAIQSVALGYGASVSAFADLSVALGSGSVANEERTVSVGNVTGGQEFRRRIVNLADGENDYDAVNKRQLEDATKGLLTMDTAKGSFLTWDTDEGLPTKKINGVDLANGSVTVDGHADDYKGGFNVTGQNGKVVSYLHSGDLKINDTSGWNSAGLKAGNVTINPRESSAAIMVDQGKFMVYDDGAFQAAGRQFLVRADGFMEAAGGTIGGVSIENEDIIAGRILANQMVATDGEFGTLTADTAVIGGIYVADTLGAFQAAGVVAGKVADGSQSLALGNGSYVHGQKGVVIGENSWISGDQSTVVGKGSWAIGDNATVLGHFANAYGDNSTAIGEDSWADQASATAVGQHGWARGANSTAIGQLSFAEEDNSTAVGQRSWATGTHSTSIGQDSWASGTNSTAIGQSSTAYAENSTALGQGAEVEKEARNAVALGAGSMATEANTVSVGSDEIKRKITNVADGAITENSTDAVSGRQFYALDAQVKVNADGVSANRMDIEALHDAGILAGNTDTHALATLGSLAIGNLAHVTATGPLGGIGTAATSIAIGNAAGVTATGTLRGSGSANSSIAMGSAANIVATGAMFSAASADSALALGTGAIISATGAASGDAIAAGTIAVGSGATVTALAIRGQDVSSQNSMALGTLASVYNASNSVALGAGSKVEAGQDYVISVGASGSERRVIHVAEGTVSEASTDAVNGSQLFATNQNVASNRADIVKLNTYTGYELGNKLNAGNAADLTTGVNNAYALAASAGKEAAKHTTVSAASDNLIVNPSDNKDGSQNYDISLNPHISVESITAESGTIGGVAFDGKGVASGADFVTSYGGETVSLNDVYDRTSLITRTDGYTTIIGDQVEVQAAHDDKLGGLYVKGAGNSTVTEFLSDGSARIGKIKLSKDGIISGVKDGVDDGDAVNVGQLKKKADAADLDGVVYWDDKKEENHTIQGVKLEDGVAIGTDFKTSYNGGVVSLNDVYDRTMHISRNESENATVIEDQVHIVAGDGETGGIYIRGKDSWASHLLEDGSFMAANGNFTLDGSGNLRVKAGKSEWLVSEEGAGMRYGNSMVAVAKGMAGIRAKKHSMIIDSNGVTFTNEKDGTTTNISGNTIWTGSVSATAIYAGDITINKDGRITGLAEGIDDMDAVNKAQLDAVSTAANQHSTVSVNGGKPEDGNLVLEKTENTDGSKNYDVSLSDQLSFSGTGEIRFGDDGMVRLNQNGLYITGENGLTQLENGRLGGLSNTSFDFTKYENGTYSHSGAGVAATQGQLADVFGWLNQKIDSIDVNGSDGNVTVDKTEGTKPGEGGESGSTNPQGPVFDVGLNKDKIDLGNVIIEGNKGNITANGTVSAGKTSISDSGVKVGTAASLTESSLTVGGKEYIGAEGLNANGQTIKNVADGKADGDAVNYGQLQTVQDQVTGNSDAIGALGQSVSRLGGEIDSVGAISAALAGLHPIDYDPTGSKYQIAAALGTYDGSSAVALGGFYNINRDILLSAGVSTVLRGERKTSGNLGVTFRVGPGTSVSDAGAARDMKEANQQIGALKEDNQVLNEKVAALEAQVQVLLKAVKTTEEENNKE